VPEFLFRFKMSEDVVTEEDEEAVRLQAQRMADAVQAKIEEIFYPWTVGFEIREFGITNNMPDFYVLAQVTDRNDTLASTVATAETSIIEIMQKMTKRDQRVGCWFQRVKGVWNEVYGLL